MGFTTAPGRVSKTDFLGFQAGEAQPASQAASRPASQPASQPAGRTFCHEGGYPKRLPGTSRDSLGAVGGQVVQFVVILGHLFGYLLAPWAPRWPPRALPWRPPGHLLHHFCVPFCNQCSRDVAVGGTGVQQEPPGGCECRFYTVNTDVLQRCAFGAQGAQKACPGLPRDVFLAPFWHLLEHLGVPFAPRGHSEAAL